MITSNHEGPVILRYKETDSATGEVIHADGFRRDNYTDALESINTLYDIVLKHHGQQAIRSEYFNSIEYEVHGKKFNLTITEV
jgi:hypothetical protein